ncbi:MULTISPECIES: ABC transporter substrate-binding protein [unclassified Beijerinckia]|uniref:ABC transporter substrate-binding protein n=1 Tax=unclassified Beijerinckia TaxID=2638183 RepID=UPI00089BD29C|nr:MULTISPECIES: ABC transporter substrate-binding protein [unclassified Beijerinckia]MDH7799033.1 branched-chain amino acid transport system substrate-binding protein [Beijerinckia sp. GAS462]SED97221.1 amino acid/amide ABC transporter substrate-binding protein, HAAT family [Beijerinckia sp. 28-YEA-48]
MLAKSMLFGLGVLTVATAARADVSVCISVSATGPASALGSTQQNSVRFLPPKVADQTLRYTVYDDATDTSLATQNARKCVNDQAADVLIGGSGTPTAAAIAPVAAEAQIPFLSLAPFAAKGDQSKWSFVVPQPMRVMIEAIVGDIKTKGIKKLGYIGYNDSLGDLTLNSLLPLAQAAGITVSPIERFARNDTSVTAQVLKIVAENPGAVLVVGSGAPAAGPNLALAERGYSGQIYHTHGSASPAFLQVAGASANGTILPVGPIGIVEQLSDDNPSKIIGAKYKTSYEAVFGAGSISSFGGYLYDAALIVATTTPKALEAGKPGTPAFRNALRTAFENLPGVPGVHGVYASTPDNHELADNAKSRVMTRVVGGKLTLLP